MDTAEVMRALGRLEGAVGEVRDDVQQLVRCVKGGNATPGLMTRVDRLEQSNKRRDRWRNWIVPPLVAVLVTLCVTKVWALLAS